MGDIKHIQLHNKVILTTVEMDKIFSSTLDREILFLEPNQDRECQAIL